MSFMFKGPAALTAGSTVPAESINSALSVAGTDLTVGNDLHVTDDLTIGDDLTVKDIIITNTGSLTVNGSNPITSIEGGDAVLVTKSYVDTAISNTHKVQVLTSVTGGVYPNVNLSTHHVYYFANSDYVLSTSPLTCTMSLSTPVNGHRVFIAWTKRGREAQTSLKLNFGSPIVVGASSTVIYRYILFNALHASVLLYYVSAAHGGPSWYSIESSVALFTNT
jgi:hypothetical protein